MYERYLGELCRYIEIGLGDWLDMRNREKGRRHRWCSDFYLVICGHCGTINQEKV